MNIYLKLFLTFFEIGLFSFGGGYSMIPLVNEKCLNFGWLTEEGIMNFIAVAESTPGPIAVNMATFVGVSQAGVLGAIVSTIGVILPSFIIILIIASLINNFMKYKGVQAVLKGIRPVIIGVIVATGLTMLMYNIFGLSSVKSIITINYKSLIIFLLIITVVFLFKKIKKKDISPIILIIISALLGIAMF